MDIVYIICNVNSVLFTRYLSHDIILLQLIASQCCPSDQITRDILKSIGSNPLFVPTMISRDIVSTQVDIIVYEV